MLPANKFRRTAYFTLFFLLLGAFTVDAARFQLDRRERDRLKKETVHAIDVIQRYHYSQRSFSDIDSKEFIVNYMRDLDNTRVFFTAEEKKFLLDRFADNLKPTYLYVGDLYPAFEIFNVYYERVMGRIDWVQERLKEPFDLDTDLSYRPDRSKEDWPADKAAADDIWERRLKYELIAELLEEETLDNAIKKLERRYTRMKRFVNEIEIHNVQETFLTSLAKLYDPHSSFFSWDSAQEFNIQISNSLVGIGAQLRDVDGYCVIESLIPGGPAEMSGQIHPGDKVIEVTQDGGEPVDVVGMKLRHVVQMIRGEEGTEVRLTILPADSSTRKVVAIVREKIELTANLASSRLFTVPVSDERTARIGVIELPSFYGEGELGQGSLSTTGDVRELIEALKEIGIDGLILDFRSNGGGRLDEAVNLTGLFVPEAPVVMKRSFNQEVDTDWARNKKVSWDGPLAVLISRSSASASEIVAGALQNHGRALVIGDDKTHGKGTVQAPIDLRNFMNRFQIGAPLQVGTVKVTVQQFFLPNGESTQSRGVLSDITIPSINQFLLEGEADLENALAWDKINPVSFRPSESQRPYLGMVDPDFITSLRERSKERIATLEEFDFLQRNIAWFEERHERKEIPLNLEVRREDREQVEAMRESFQDERISLSERLAYPFEKVDLEVTQRRDLTHQQKLLETPLPSGELRINQFYQKVFYYSPEGSEDIKEVWVEYISYDRLTRHSTEIAAALSESTGLEITEEQTETLLTRFRNTDRTSSFQPVAVFEGVFGEKMDRETIEQTLPVFFRTLVELDPEILRDTPRLDIPLRESLRVLADWIELRDIPLIKPDIALKEIPDKS